MVWRSHPKRTASEASLAGVAFGAPVPAHSSKTSNAPRVLLLLRGHGQKMLMTVGFFYARLIRHYNIYTAIHTCDVFFSAFVKQIKPRGRWVKMKMSCKLLGSSK